MSDAIETVKLSHVNLEIRPDNFGDHDCPITQAYDRYDRGAGLQSEGVIFATFQKNSTLSELHPFCDPPHALGFAGRKWQAFPLYYFEHGQCSYSVCDFNDKWDSGQVGYILVKKSIYRGEARRLQVAYSWCEAVTRWCNGEYYGYVVLDKARNVPLDSCWGFDDIGACLEAGLDVAKSHNSPLANEEARQAEAARPDMYRRHGHAGLLDRHCDQCIQDGS
jgi:hypothetical protein